MSRTVLENEFSARCEVSLSFVFVVIIKFTQNSLPPFPLAIISNCFLLFHCNLFVTIVEYCKMIYLEVPLHFRSSSNFHCTMGQIVNHNLFEFHYEPLDFSALSFYCIAFSLNNNCSFVICHNKDEHKHREGTERRRMRERENGNNRNREK